MTDLRQARIDVSIQTADGQLGNCSTEFTVDNLKKDLDYNDIADGQQVGTMTCDGQSSSFSLVKLNGETIGIDGTSYEITLPDDAAHLILTPPATSTAVVPFDPSNEEEAAKFADSPILVKIEFDTPQDIGDRKGATSHYKRFENLEAFKKWLPEEAAGTVKGVWALKSGASTESPILVSFDSKDERDRFLSQGEGFILITRKNGNDSEPETIFSAEDLKTELASINGLAEAERPDQVILIHLQNTSETNRLNATTYIDTPDRVAAYAEYITEQESEGAFSLGAFDVKRRTWFERNGLDIRGRFGWSALLQQRARYIDRNPNITTGGIDQEYGDDYLATRAAQDEKKFFEGLGIGVGATLYLGEGFGVGLDFDWSRMKASWMGIDPTHGSKFDRIMLDVELRWSMARALASKWSGFKVFDPQIYGNLGYGHIWGNTTLQESFNPISTKLDFGFASLGLDIPFRVCQISDSWAFNLGPYLKGVFPFAEQFRDQRYGSTNADLSPYLETGVVATFSYGNTRPDTVTPTVGEPEYVRPAEKPVDLASQKTVPEPKGPTVPDVVELPKPKPEKLTIHANFELAMLTLDEKSEKEIDAKLADIKRIVTSKPGVTYVIRIDGHADSGGTWRTNETLSLGRANTYKDRLIARAIEQNDEELIAALKGATIIVSGLGESKPLDGKGQIITVTYGRDQGVAGKNDTWIFPNGDIERRDMSRRIEMSFEALEPGATAPLPRAISDEQKASDGAIAKSVAGKLAKGAGAIETASYIESDNSLVIVLNSYGDKDLKKAYDKFLAAVKSAQTKTSMSSQCTVRFVMKGNPTQPQQDAAREAFAAFGKWPTAATREFALDTSAEKGTAIIKRLKEEAAELVKAAAARKTELHAASFDVQVAGQTYKVYPVKIETPAGKDTTSTGLTRIDRLIINEILASGDAGQPTFYYNFTAGSEANKTTYLNGIAGLAGEKRAGITQFYTSENPTARLADEYLFVIVGDAQVDLGKADDEIAKAIREAIFKKYGPQNPQ